HNPLGRQQIVRITLLLTGRNTTNEQGLSLFDIRRYIDAAPFHARHLNRYRRASVRCRSRLHIANRFHVDTSFKVYLLAIVANDSPNLDPGALFQHHNLRLLRASESLKYSHDKRTLGTRLASRLHAVEDRDLRRIEHVGSLVALGKINQLLR